MAYFSVFFKKYPITLLEAPSRKCQEFLTIPKGCLGLLTLGFDVESLFIQDLLQMCVFTLWPLVYVSLVLLHSVQIYHIYL